jgi:hypothetical protein
MVGQEERAFGNKSGILICLRAYFIFNLDLCHIKTWEFRGWFRASAQAKKVAVQRPTF